MIFAAPATPSTLSKLIVTSANITVIIAFLKFELSIDIFFPQFYFVLHLYIICNICKEAERHQLISIQ